MKKFSIILAVLLLASGIAAPSFAAVSSVNNNFSMVNGTGGLTGGTNDVLFTWDLTKKTSVAASGQVSNATLVSSCPFFGLTWAAHDVTIYGPGTYTVYDDCPAGSPGCGTGNAVTFTVGTGQLGAHMLFDWGGTTNIDVVDVWVPNAAFGPSTMCADALNCGGQATCNANPAATVWSWMSSDWDGDGFNGAGMTDGPFVGFNANFNVNVVGTENNNFTMINGTGGLTGGTNDVLFTWNGTKLTSVAASGQVSNATLVSSCPFFGLTWAAHDVTIYGPGTYTVYDDCPAGSPGCGTGNAVTFTVGTGQLGAHMLFDWGGTTNIDVVDVWAPNAAFGPSTMCADALNCGGQATCSSNAAGTIWDWMSSDWNGDGFNGFGMTDGPFVGFNANFNVMGVPPGCSTEADCNDSDACTADVCDTATGVCSNTPIVCTDNNACTTDTCDSATGCVFTPKVCNDNNLCTTDSCNTATGNCVFPAKNCNDNNACTTDTCNTATGACINTAIVCNDNNACSTDTCNTATGCVFTPPGTCTGPGSANTTLNNFSMLDPTGKTIGGTNDVKFAWDGTKKTSVSTSGQVTNALIASTCPFQGITWSAHDVAVYGPGTYTVYAGCAAGSPGCGLGTALTFTVGANQLAAHMLFDWGASKNIDVVDVWSPTTTFAPSALWTGACGSNPATKVWDAMSSDFDGDGINGKKMVDGPFIGFGANFNLMGTVTGVATKVGIFLSHGDWYRDQNGNNSWDGTPTDRWDANFGFGVNGAIPVVTSVTGTTNIGIYENGTWYIDQNGNGAWDGTPTDAQYFFGSGVANAIPVTGDWTGTGTTRIGIYENGIWYLDLNGNKTWDGTPTDAQYSFGNGVSNAIPVTGDWTGTGTTRIGIYENGTWRLDLNGNGVWDGTPTDALYSFGGGIANAVPVTGDWTGTGTTRIGIYENGTWYLDQNGNGVWDGASTDAQYLFGNGVAGALPVTGKW